MSETWEEAVYQIIRSHNRAISLKEIYEAMDRHALVGAHHREIWGNQPNLHHWVRSVLAKLKRRGAIRHVGRGLYMSN